MIQHITYSDHRMTIAARKCVESALKHGCDSSIHLKPENINRNFYEKYKHILDQDRGAGFWLWKPYIILEALNRLKNNDILVYTDAGVEWVANIDQLLNEMQGEIMVFGNGWRHGDWCKGDVLKGMNAENFVNHDQVQASCIILKRTKETIDFVEQWLKFCTMDNFIDDTLSFWANEPTFREHRHDQAILTNLVLLNNIPFNRWPAQYNLRGNEKYNNKYGVIFNHHGRRNDGTR